MSLSIEVRVSRARVRFLNANVSRAGGSSCSCVGNGRFLELGCSGRLVSGSPVGFSSDGTGLSEAHTSQQRKLAGFSNVHVGHVQGASYELLSAVRSNTSGAFSDVVSGGALGVTVFGVPSCGVSLESAGVGGSPERGPAGFSWLGGMYEDPYFSRSSSWISSMKAWRIASSFASSSSAFVLNPFRDASSASSVLLSVPEAHPLVTSARRCAASALSLRTSVPRSTGAPPSRFPEFLERILRCSAAARACRRASSIGIRAPPRRLPCDRKPSPVYPLVTSSSCSSLSWFHRE